MGERIERFSCESRFDELAPLWDHLAEAEPTPFARHPWFAAWWSTFGRCRRCGYRRVRVERDARR